ncbi:MAG: transposase family protein [Candidatus Symbiothrix sp.]|nr:transposase family protein [Candidatus Symbiothrix sp.]
MQRRFPELIRAFSKVKDSRKRKYYGMEEILMGGLGMFLLKQGSGNSINNKRREANFAEHYEETFSVRLPHQDTVAEVLCELAPEELEQVKMDSMSKFLEQKWLRKSRLLKQYYLVAIDATGVVSFDHRHCEHCLTRKSKNGETTYFHYVLEAKLVTACGFCFSLATEWVENPEGEFDKQDCERKAFIRLAAKLKKHYSRLFICILADGLYPYDGAFSICETNAWKYIFVLPEKSLKTVHEELTLSKLRKPIAESYTVKQGWRIGGAYRCQNEIPYQKHSLNWFQCLETRVKEVKVGKEMIKKTKESCFEYVTNITPNKENIQALSQAGRLRWKVENEGFNAQKCGDYELEHKYFRNSYTGLKNTYTLLQIAHAFNQLVEKSEPVKSLLETHSKETIRNIWCNLVAYMLFATPLGKRPDDADIYHIPPHPS